MVFWLFFCCCLGCLFSSIFVLLVCVPPMVLLSDSPWPSVLNHVKNPDAGQPLTWEGVQGWTHTLLIVSCPAHLSQFSN